MTKNLLVVTAKLPEYDKFSGDLRLFQLLKTLGTKYNVAVCCIAPSRNDYEAKHSESDRYVRELRNIGVRVEYGNVPRLLRSHPFDVVLFEFYYPALEFLKAARIWRPETRIVVDSVDIHFRRLFRKSKVTGRPEDLRLAQNIKNEELAVYRASDAVIVVTEPDKEALLKECPSLHVEIVPNIHPVPELNGSVKRDPNTLLFVGNFHHEPNVDAVLYFCREILPLIHKKYPDVRLKVVGSNPPSAISDLKSDRVEILGYVPDLTPYLRSSCISIAPLRYGAGLKGKVGEAMSFGLPVVTTSIGAEGFNATPGEHLLIADNPDDFASAVIRLLTDMELHRRMVDAGLAFINDRFSPHALSGAILEALSRIECAPVHKVPLLRRLRARMANTYDRHIGWRFQYWMS